MTKSNIIWGLIFGFLSSVTYFHFVSNDSVYQSEKLFKYVGFVDYSEDVISHEQLMKLIEENYQRIPKCNYGVAIVKTPETAANIGWDRSRSTGAGPGIRLRWRYVRWPPP